MITVADRLGPLIKKLESGESITQREVNNLASLQLLDLAKLGQDYVQEVAERNAKATQDLAQSYQMENQELEAT